MVATLTYTGGARDFTIYRVNPHPIKLFRTLKESIRGKLSEKFVAYRRVITVEFAPVEGNKTAIGFLYGFLFGSSRQLTFNAITYDVTIDGNSQTFDFLEGTFFGDSFSITFYEKGISTITDTESTRIFKPKYSAEGEGISSETLSLYVNLVDDIAAEVIKHDFRYIDDVMDDSAYSYRHVITIDTGPIYKSALKDWLDEFVQWGSKQIDTTSSDPMFGTVYNVVFDGDGIDWQLVDGVHGVVSAVLVFKEIEPRTSAETFAGPIWDEVVFDEVVAQ